MAQSTTTNPADTNGKPEPANPLHKRRWSQFDKWLRPEYVGSEPIALTITDITYEDGHLNGRAVKTLALHFAEVPNLFALSAVNQRAIAALFGNLLGSAIGNKIALQKTRTKFGPTWKYPLRILTHAPAPADASADELLYVPLEEADTNTDDADETIAEEIE